MIYTPRAILSLHEFKMKHGDVQNPCLCTKIRMSNFEISISMDSNHGLGDLARADIRVYRFYGLTSVDVTSEFFHDDEDMLRGDAETLLRVMEQIKEL